MKSRILKILFFGLFVKPLVFIGLGLNVFFRQRLPNTGPAIIVANHNSHLDTLVLMSLYPLTQIHRIRPVAAADYFLSNKLLAWFSLNVIGIIPLKRGQVKDKNALFSECYRALDKDDILLLFPEGSRGMPEQMSSVKRGIHLLVENRASINVTPVVMHGLGRALPKGEAIFVPFNCDVVVGEPIQFVENAKQYTHSISDSLNALLTLCITHQSLGND